MKKPKTWKQRFDDWYRGPWISPPKDDNAFIIRLGRHKPSRTARALRAIVEFWMRDWKWIIGTVLAIAAIIISLEVGR